MSQAFSHDSVENLATNISSCVISLDSNPPQSVTSAPSLVVSSGGDFIIDGTTLTRTGLNRGANLVRSTVLIPEPFTSGIVSMTITFLTSPWLSEIDGFASIGLMDSTSRLPILNSCIGHNVSNSVGLDTYGYLSYNTPSSDSQWPNLSNLEEGDCVRMEVDLDSTPRTVQFFKNGEAGRCYMSGIPSSVRIGLSVQGYQLSIRIDNISRPSKPTPISEGMREVKWSRGAGRDPHKAGGRARSAEEGVQTKQGADGLVDLKCGDAAEKVDATRSAQPDPSSHPTSPNPNLVMVGRDEHKARLVFLPPQTSYDVSSLIWMKEQRVDVMGVMAEMLEWCVHLRPMFSDEKGKHGGD
ncbi:hypothetical protein BLNAU_9390 [Blattamonas nauphoetae]|uniref:B30.2/SPRY domain-containing protein n=1 Tax=Blattamonas nauphoetae TaxID=2049346 RepID=A0ABQ9XW73_9EUKA|nr:hypothetical protein BLNAU_9390 [Blattamonas nauphoetae]